MIRHSDFAASRLRVNQSGTRSREDRTHIGIPPGFVLTTVGAVENTRDLERRREIAAKGAATRWKK